MKPPLRFLIAGVLVLLIGTGFLSASASFTFQHPRAHDARFVVDRNGRARLAAKPEPPSGVPRVVADKTEFDFELLPPGSTGNYDFTVRNAGTAPLRLQAGGTTCKCTLSHVSSDAIPPGGEGKVRLTWNTGLEIIDFSQEAEIRTNDPQTPHLTFRVFGRVQARLASEPAEMQLVDLVPGRPERLSVLVYSQEFSRFAIDEVTSSLGVADWTARPADVAELAPHKARYGWWVEVDATMPREPHRFTAWLRVRITPEDGSPLDHEITLHGELQRRLMVLGKYIDPEGRVDLGHLARGEGAVANLLVKVQDEQRSLPVRRLTVEPAFVAATLEPRGDIESGLYRLTIRVPTDAPVSHHLGIHHGRVRFEFDHPRVKELDLQVHFGIR